MVCNKCQFLFERRKWSDGMHLWQMWCCCCHWVGHYRGENSIIKCFFLRVHSLQFIQRQRHLSTNDHIKSLFGTLMTCTTKHVQCRLFLCFPGGVGVKVVSTENVKLIKLLLTSFMFLVIDSRGLLRSLLILCVSHALNCWYIIITGEWRPVITDQIRWKYIIFQCQLD